VVLRIKSHIIKHASIFVLGIASVSFFLLNILLKDILSPQDYGLYSILITYCSLISSFGLFGLDQVLLRTSVIEGKEIAVDSRLISMVLFVLLFMSLISSSVVSKYYDFGISYLNLILLSSFLILIKLSYQILRLLSKFTYSQFALNIWKLGLPLLLFLSLSMGFDITLSSITKYLFYCCLLSLGSYFLFYSKINFKKLKYTQKDLIKFASGFFLTLFTLSVLNFSDRFIIERKFGLEEIGNYFFYVNLFLYPFTFFSTYIGFRELVSFKKAFSIDVFNKKLILATKLAILFGVIYLLLILSLDYLHIFDFNLDDYKLVIFLLMLWGIIKVVASLLSSAIGALTSQQDLNRINLLSIILIFSLGLVIYYCHTITSIIISFLIVWVIRYSLYYLLVYRKEY
jgi:O-antigen/teichoic acid export membrane protein